MRTRQTAEERDFRSVAVFAQNLSDVKVQARALHSNRGREHSKNQIIESELKTFGQSLCPCGFFVMTILLERNAIRPRERLDNPNCHTTSQKQHDYDPSLCSCGFVIKKFIPDLMKFSLEASSLKVITPSDKSKRLTACL